MDAPLVFLVTGLPATGKSVLAGAIARRLRCPLIAKDLIKEPLLEVLGAADRQRSRALSDAAFAVAFALARSLLSTGTPGPFVLEGNFRPGEHEEALREVAAGAQLVQILCTAPEPLRRARLAARALDPQRHRGHDDATLATEAPPAGFLDLPGERLTHDSAEADAGSALLGWIAATKG